MGDVIRFPWSIAERDPDPLSIPLVIPVHVLSAYTRAYPFLRWVAGRAGGGDIQAAQCFARVACHLAAVPGVTAAEVWLLARLAEVEATGVPEDARDACHMKES